MSREERKLAALNLVVDALASSHAILTEHSTEGRVTDRMVRLMVEGQNAAREDDLGGVAEAVISIRAEVDRELERIR